MIAYVELVCCHGVWNEPLYSNVITARTKSYNFRSITDPDYRSALKIARVYRFGYSG